MLLREKNCTVCRNSALRGFSVGSRGSLLETTFAGLHIVEPHLCSPVLDFEVEVLASAAVAQTKNLFEVYHISQDPLVRDRSWTKIMC